MINYIFYLDDLLPMYFYLRLPVICIKIRLEFSVVRLLKFDNTYNPSQFTTTLVTER